MSDVFEHVCNENHFTITALRNSVITQDQENSVCNENEEQYYIIIWSVVLLTCLLESEKLWQLCPLRCLLEITHNQPSSAVQSLVMCVTPLTRLTFVPICQILFSGWAPSFTAS